MMLSKHDKHLKGSAEFLPPRPPPPTPKIRPTSNTSGVFTILLSFMLSPKCQNTLQKFQNLKQMFVVFLLFDAVVMTCIL